jgi:uncharacterized protein YkwD
MRRRVSLCALALLASLVIGTAANAAAAPPAHVAQGAYGTAMLRALNRMRAQRGLPAFAADSRMNRGATGYAGVLAHHGFFSHGAWASRVAHAAGQAHPIGEVLGWLAPGGPHGEASWLVNAWLHSPEHRRALLDGSFRRVGIGRSVGSEGGRWAAVYTVDFAGGR